MSIKLKFQKKQIVELKHDKNCLLTNISLSILDRYVKTNRLSYFFSNL